MKTSAKKLNNGKGKVILLFSLVGMISGCAPTLQPGAQRVALAAGPVPNSCQFKGDVSSGTMHGPLTSHSSVEQYQTTILKNQASQLGANTVFVLFHKTTYYSTYLIEAGDFVQEIGSHTMSGKAYYCNPMIMNKINHRSKMVSDAKSSEN